MKSVEEIRRNMAHAIGTERYIKHSLWSGLVFTDGVNQLRDDADCHWLIDAIASYRRTEEFQLWTLKVDNGSGVLTMHEGNGKKAVVTQEFDYTNFPLKEVEFYVEPGGYGTAENWTQCMVLMLTNER
jgi:hypothetical protein